jgi:hypothetical protein
VRPVAVLAAFPNRSRVRRLPAVANNHAEFYRGVEAARRAIGAAAGADPAATAAAVHGAMEALLGDTQGQPARACHRGCAHCCHFPVGVSFGEALRLARRVDGEPTLRDRVVRAATATAALPWTDLVGIACPLLVDGECAVYAERPLPCRALASRDAHACASSLAGSDRPVPRDETAFWRGLGASDALADAGQLGTHELRAAIAALLGRPADAAVAFAAARPAG